MIGQPNLNQPPLMTALYNGPNGEKWQASKIQVYGWIDTGFNVSSSNKSHFANAPAAYDIVPNSIQLDQAALYIERVPDTVQTDHFDWGFRLTGIYGEDYRYTTSKGVFSNQLLGKNQTDGFDPVMAYVDLYFPKVANGMNIRIGRYVSLPDIEAQLAPNNYTFSHSLLYVYDCYTQEGVNITTQLSKGWMLQTGLSAGCDSAIWTRDAKPTGTLCLNYTWRTGQDTIYGCANSLNSGKYAYNNMSAFYLTWYHKINKNWHFDTESWYQYEKDVPSIFGTLPIENGANGAWCATAQQSCYAPEWAILNYVERQFGKKRHPLDPKRVLRRYPGPAHRLRDQIHRAQSFLESLDRLQHRFPPGSPLRTLLSPARLRQRNQEEPVHVRRRYDLVLLATLPHLSRQE